MLNFYTGTIFSSNYNYTFSISCMNIWPNFGAQNHILNSIKVLHSF